MGKKPIRVAHLITNFAVGGAQDYLLLIVRGLDQSLFTPVIAGRMEGEWVPQVQSLPGVEWYDIRALRRDISPLNDLVSIYQVKKFCEHQKIDILHTHSSKAGVVGRLGGSLAGVRATVHTVHGFSFHDFMSPAKRAAFVSIERIMSRYTTTLLLYSHGDEAIAKKLGIGARRSVETFYYGIDYAPFGQPFDRQAIRRSLGFQDGDRVVGYTGRFSEQKALHVLIEAFAHVHKSFPGARLLLAGDGHLRSQLEQLIARLGISQEVVITGFRSDIPAMLAAMDLFVMTSLWEGLSRSLAEAMYARLPIIATDVGGTGDAVRNNETGWLVAPNSVGAVIDALNDALAHPDRAASMAERGYLWSRKAFDLGTMQRRVAELYERLIEGPGKGK